MHHDLVHGAAPPFCTVDLVPSTCVYPKAAELRVRAMQVRSRDGWVRALALLHSAASKSSRKRGEKKRGGKNMSLPVEVDAYM